MTTKMTAYELLQQARKLREQQAKPATAAPAPAPAAPAPAPVVQAQAASDSPQNNIASAMKAQAKAKAKAQAKAETDAKAQAQAQARADERKRRIDNAAANLVSRSMLVTLHVGIPGNERRDQKTTEQVKREHRMGKDAGGWDKNVFPPSKFRAVSSAAAAARKAHYELSLPWPVKGQVLVLHTNRQRYLEAMNEWKKSLETIRDTFLAQLDDMRQWAKVEHNGSYDPSLYQEQELREKFTFELIPTPVPSSSHWVGEMREALGVDCKAIDHMVRQAVIDAEMDVWHRMMTPLRSFVEILVKRAEGTRTKLTDETITNIAEIADMVPSLNITCDAELDDFAKELKALVGKLTKETLSEDEALEKEVLEKAQAIMNRMVSRC